jgi:hypothetical protein
MSGGSAQLKQGLRGLTADEVEEGRPLQADGAAAVVAEGEYVIT